MDEKNRTPSFLDLLEHMKSYLGTARKMGGDITERQKALTDTETDDDYDSEDDRD